MSAENYRVDKASGGALIFHPNKTAIRVNNLSKKVAELEKENSRLEMTLDLLMKHQGVSYSDLLEVAKKVNK